MFIGLKNYYEDESFLKFINTETVNKWFIEKQITSNSSTLYQVQDENGVYWRCDRNAFTSCTGEQIKEPLFSINDLTEIVKKKYERFSSIQAEFMNILSDIYKKNNIRRNEKISLDRFIEFNDRIDKVFYKEEFLKMIKDIKNEHADEFRNWEKLRDLPIEGFVPESYSICLNIETPNLEHFILEDLHMNYVFKYNGWVLTKDSTIINKNIIKDKILKYQQEYLNLFQTGSKLKII